MLYLLKFGKIQMCNAQLSREISEMRNYFQLIDFIQLMLQFLETKQSIAVSHFSSSVESPFILILNYLVIFSIQVYNC